MDAAPTFPTRCHCTLHFLFGQRIYRPFRCFKKPHDNSTLASDILHDCKGDVTFTFERRNAEAMLQRGGRSLCVEAMGIRMGWLGKLSLSHTFGSARLTLPRIIYRFDDMNNESLGCELTT